MHIERITYIESESIETYYGNGLKKWVKREQSATVFLTDKDDPNKADELAKQFVKEKLGAINKVSGNEEKSISQPEEPLAEIQVEKRSLTQQILDCETAEELENYKFPASLNPTIKLEYDKRMYILTH